MKRPGKSEEVGMYQTITMHWATCIPKVRKYYREERFYLPCFVVREELP